MTAKPLTNDERWLLAYASKNIHHWWDVRDGASKAMKSIQTHDDFVDWAACFLPQERREKMKTALTTEKLRRISGTTESKREVKQTSIKLTSEVVDMIKAQAKAEKCSPSDVLRKRLA